MNLVKTDSTDHQLIEQFRNGSPEAMEKIVERYEESIFNFGLRMCGQVQDAEDIMQETFLNALRSLHNFREETKLKNWLFRIAANACLRKRRKKKFELERELSHESLMPGAGSEAKFDIPSLSPDPDSELLRAELRDVINDAVSSLPPKYRMVFSLRDVEGFDTEETAQILGITSQAVKTRLHRARLFLRKKISEHYRGE